jgi:hypothetical protein
MAERVVPSINSLVKYDSPVLVIKQPVKKPAVKVIGFRDVF